LKTNSSIRQPVTVSRLDGRTRGEASSVTQSGNRIDEPYLLIGEHAKETMDSRGGVQPTAILSSGVGLRYRRVRSKIRGWARV